MYFKQKIVSSTALEVICRGVRRLKSVSIVTFSREAPT